VSTFAAVIASKALVMLDAGKADAALDLAEKAVSGDPECNFSNFVHGSILQRLGRYSDALESYDRSQMVENAGWHYQRATCLSRTGRHKEALAAADAGIKVDPTDPIAWYRKGAALIRYARQNPTLVDRKMLKQGEAAMLRAIELDPDCYIARFDLAELYFVAGKTKASETMIQEAMALKFGDPRLHRIAAYVALRAGRLEEAASHADIVISACPDEPEALSLMLRVRRMIDSPFYRLSQRIFWNLSSFRWVGFALSGVVATALIYADASRAQAYIVIGIFGLVLLTPVIVDGLATKRADKKPKLSPGF
jgi:tetratricopeptide (TPR) repeat protein